MGFLNIIQKRNNEVPVGEGNIREIPYCQGLNFQGVDCNNGALALSAMYNGVEIISNTIALLPINVVCRNAKCKEIHPSHTLKYAFERNLISQFNLIKQMISDMLLYGNGFALIRRSDDGTVVGFRYLPAPSVQINYNEINQDLYYTATGVKGKILPSQILHIYKNSINGVEGRGVISYAKRTLNLANYTENATSDYWAKGMHAFGILHANIPLQGKQAADAVNYVNNQIGQTENKIRFIPYDLDFSPLTQDADKSQMIESRTFNIAEVARYLCVSPTLLGELSHSQYNSLEMAQLDLILHCVQPIIKMVESEFNRKLLDYEKDINLHIEFDMDDIMKADKATMGEYLTKLVSGGIISVNEAREILGYNPIDGGDNNVIAYTDIEQNTINDK